MTGKIHQVHKMVALQLLVNSVDVLDLEWSMIFSEPFCSGMASSFCKKFCKYCMACWNSDDGHDLRDVSFLQPVIYRDDLVATAHVCHIILGHKTALVEAVADRGGDHTVPSSLCHIHRAWWHQFLQRRHPGQLLCGVLGTCGSGPESFWQYPLPLAGWCNCQRPHRFICFLPSAWHSMTLAKHLRSLTSSMLCYCYTSSLGWGHRVSGLSRSPIESPHWPWEGWSLPS